MQHYFGKIQGNEAILGPEEAHHLLNVRRANLGEAIEVGDGESVFECKVVSLNPLRIAVIKEIEERRELPCEVTLAFSWLKGDHNELIVLKGTELGIKHFAPFISERTVARPEGKEKNKIERLRKIAEEGTKQCRRAEVPSVEEFASYGQILAKKADHKVLAYEGMAGDSRSLLKALSSVRPGESILFVVGPEGGFSEKEAKMAVEAGFSFVSLGGRILRAETAAIYGASVISASVEE